MYYRDKTVRMQMPIGKIETDIEDEDELSIIWYGEVWNKKVMDKKV